MQLFQDSVCLNTNFSLTTNTSSEFFCWKQQNQSTLNHRKEPRSLFNIGFSRVHVDSNGKYKQWEGWISSMLFYAIGPLWQPPSRDAVNQSNNISLCFKITSFHSGTVFH